MVYIGIDVGGTNLAVGVVDESFHILAQAETPTLVGRPYQEMVKDMVMCTRKALDMCGKTEQDIHCIGLGVPGVADPRTGYVAYCTNLHWYDVPLREEIQKYINKPVFFDNDATVAGYAESVAGVSRGCKCSVFLTIGTGLGGGIVINGRPWSGAHGVGSEIGHMTLELNGHPCNCGNDGCVEKYCSATALIQMGRDACREHPDSAILKNCGTLEKITAKDVIDAARAGDEVGMRVFTRFTKYLAITINNIVDFLDPEMVVLGGGVSRAGEFLLQAVREKLPRYQFYKSLPYPEVVLATLGNEAGIIGAALLGKDM